jgi:serine/threonine protein kinase
MEDQVHFFEYPALDLQGKDTIFWMYHFIPRKLEDWTFPLDLLKNKEEVVLLASSKMGSLYKCGMQIFKWIKPKDDFQNELDILIHALGVSGAVQLVQQHDGHWLEFKDDGVPIKYLQPDPPSHGCLCPIVWCELVDTIQRIRELGVIHRDIKPSNLLWNETRIRIMVIDLV